jgi:tetratricopeptide (TPR) repeat protein
MTKTGLSREAERHQPLTDADFLRRTLDDLEAQVGVLGRSGAAEASQIPAMFEAVTSRIQALKARGGTLQVEDLRLKTLFAQFERKADVFVRTVGGPAAVAKLRPQDGPEDHWWWYTDRIVSRQKRTRNIRYLQIGGIVTAVLLVVVVVYQLFLAPSPEVKERIERTNNAQILAEAGEFEAGIQELLLAQTAVPDDPVLFIMQGAYAEQLGDTAQAEQAFGTAKLLMETEEEFLLTRAQIYQQLMRLDESLADLEEALARNPNSATAYYIQATAYQLRGDLSEAYTAYLRSTDLASEQGDSQLEAMARMQLAYLAQRMVVPEMGNPTATPQ